MGELVSVSVVGSTGSVGTQTLDVIRAEPGRFRVECIGALRNVELLIAQAAEFRPRVVAVGDDRQVAAIRDRLPPGTDLVGGPRAMAEIANEADVCVNGVVGFAGLPVTLAALAGGQVVVGFHPPGCSGSHPQIHTGPVRPGRPRACVGGAAHHAVEVAEPVAEMVAVTGDSARLDVALEDDNRCTKPAQLAGGGQSTRATADDEHVDFAHAGLAR